MQESNKAKRLKAMLIRSVAKEIVDGTISGEAVLEWVRSGEAERLCEMYQADELGLAKAIDKVVSELAATVNP
jgi:hypothetical protein